MGVQNLRCLNSIGPYITDLKMEGLTTDGQRRQEGAARARRVRNVRRSLKAALFEESWVQTSTRTMCAYICTCTLYQHAQISMYTYICRHMYVYICRKNNIYIYIYYRHAHLHTDIDLHHVSHRYGLGLRLNGRKMVFMRPRTGLTGPR